MSHGRFYPPRGAAGTLTDLLGVADLMTQMQLRIEDVAYSIDDRARRCEWSVREPTETMKMVERKDGIPLSYQVADMNEQAEFCIRLLGMLLHGFGIGEPASPEYQERLTKLAESFKKTWADLQKEVQS